MNVDFVNPFLKSLLNVFFTMVEVDLEPGEPRVKFETTAFGDVTGIISMVGEKAQGSFSLTLDKALAVETMHRMLGERPTEISEDVIDLMGELTNMVTGGAKNILSDMGYDFEMATPSVVAGKYHTIVHESKGPVIVMPFFSKYGYAHIEICFDR